MTIRLDLCGRGRLAARRGGRDSPGRGGDSPGRGEEAHGPAVLRLRTPRRWEPEPGRTQRRGPGKKENFAAGSFERNLARFAAVLQRDQALVETEQFFEVQSREIMPDLQRSHKEINATKVSLQFCEKKATAELQGGLDSSPTPKESILNLRFFHIKQTKSSFSNFPWGPNAFKIHWKGPTREVTKQLGIGGAHFLRCQGGGRIPMNPREF